MMLNLWILIQAAVPSEGWEILKSGMLAATTAGVAWTARTVFYLRDDVRDLKAAVGTDGKNGLKKTADDLHGRLGKIEARHARIDAVAEAERDSYEGPERRRSVRRLRDQEFLPHIPPVNPDQD